jgi:hypothetical protein
MTGTVALACVVPDGSDYTCDLGSQELAFGTSTTITITKRSEVELTKYGSTAYLASFAFVWLISSLRKRRRLGVLLIATLCVSTALTGCGSMTRDVTPASAVLRVQAISRTSATTVRSIELFINP